MQHAIRTLIAASVLGLGAMPFAAPNFASAEDFHRTFVISYKDLDLTRPRDQQRLQRRIHWAVYRACDYEASQHTHRREVALCLASGFAQAQAQLGGRMTVADALVPSRLNSAR